MSDDVTDGASDASALVVVNQNMKQRCKAIGEHCFVCLDKRRAGDSASHQLIANDEGWKQRCTRPDIRPRKCVCQRA
jgi:hypothetical protein